jgi:hypothetical protein
METRKWAGLYDQLHESASHEAEFSDFGDVNYQEGLRVLLHALDTDRELSESASQVAHGWIVGALIGRLYAVKGWHERPEVLNLRVHNPLIITGLPRTGTTALHKLLSVDSQFQGLELWLAQAPMVRPPRETWFRYPPYRDCAKNLESFYARVPAARRMHESAADEADECVMVLMQDFLGAPWSVLGLPTYDNWMCRQSALASYQRYADVLRLISAHEGHRRWLLKNPFHLVEIEALLEVFPDARIIHTHRDPEQAIYSLCSLQHTFGQGLLGEPKEIGARQCAYWRRALDRTQAAAEVRPTQFFNVEHEDFIRDPLGVVQSIYKHFDLRHSAESDARMRSWLATHPKSRHGEHRYSADEWGVTPAEIREAFADYRAQHRYD